MKGCAESKIKREQWTPSSWTLGPLAALVCTGDCRKDKEDLHALVTVPEPTLALRYLLVPETSKAGID